MSVSRRDFRRVADQVADRADRADRTRASILCTSRFAASAFAHATDRGIQGCTASSTSRPLPSASTALNRGTCMFMRKNPVMQHMHAQGARAHSFTQLHTAARGILICWFFSERGEQPSHSNHSNSKRPLDNARVANALKNSVACFVAQVSIHNNTTTQQHSNTATIQQYNVRER